MRLNQRWPAALQLLLPCGAVLPPLFLAGRAVAATPPACANRSASFQSSFTASILMHTAAPAARLPRDTCEGVALVSLRGISAAVVGGKRPRRETGMLVHVWLMHRVRATLMLVLCSYVLQLVGALPTRVLGLQ